MNLTKPKFCPLFVVVSFVCLFFIIEASIWDYHRKTIKTNLEAAMIQSPLPDVKVNAERANKSIKNAYLKDYEFGREWFTMNIPVWEEVLESFKGKPSVNYLEIGVYEGGSLFWMLENILTEPTSRATAIDIFCLNSEKTYYANLKLSGLSDKVTTIKDYSQLAMRELPFESFDIIYIDGSHVKNDALEDAVLSWRLIKKGGILIFDNYRYALQYRGNNGKLVNSFCKPAIDLFAQCFDEYFEVIHNDYQLILRRIK